MQRLAAQIEEPIAQAHILRILLLARNRQRQLCGGGEQHGIVCPDLDFAGGEVRVDRLFCAGHHPTGDRHHTLRLQALDHLEHRAVYLGNDLHHAIMIAQIDEHQIAMITLAVDPAGHPDCLPGVSKARLGAGMGAICVHEARF